MKGFNSASFFQGYSSADWQSEKKGGEKVRYFKQLILPAVVAMALLVSPLVNNSQATEDVRNSKHNLVANPNIQAQGTTQVCVFCHTPHGGRTDVANGAAPLWNRALPPSSSTHFTPYTSPNFDAQGVTPGIPKGVSLACLSCHDGTVAFDALINLPGSGGYQGANPTSAGWTFNGAYVDQNNSFKEGASPPEPFPNLGTDLSNDHPISMEIPCGVDPQFDNTIGDPNRPPQICNNLDTAALAAGKISPLYRGNSNTVLPPDKRDWIRAYPTNYPNDSKPYIECASCHNPHENTSTRFLRYPSFYGTPEEAAVGGFNVLNADRNAGSLLCLSCHQK